MKKMKLSDIKIHNSFAESTPSEEKMCECRYNWRMYGKQDRYIVVDSEGYLIDGYIQYLILVEHKEEYAEVKISNRRKKRWYRKNVQDWNIPRYKDNPTTYIFGIHPNSNCDKEFVWRVPESWTWLAENVQIGDTVLCATKFGYSPVVVTKVEVLNKPPIVIPIKKVCNKKIWRNGIILDY